MRVDSDEHIEAWFSLEQLVNKLLDTSKDVAQGVYDAETVEKWGLDPELVGQRVSEVGLPPEYTEGMVEQIELQIEALGRVQPPSADALRDYYVRKLVGKIEDLTSKVDGMADEIRRVL